MQNKCLKHIIGMNFYSTMTDVLKCLKIFNINQLYIYSKINFIKSINNNLLCVKIFNTLIDEYDSISKRSKSFKKDLQLITNYIFETLLFWYK